MAGTPTPRWFRRLVEFGARRGVTRYQVMLGAMLEQEPPLNVNLRRANVLYRDAAEKGNIQAMWNLGVNYLGTKGGERNPAQAVLWLTRAAEGGHALAAWALAKLYLSGKVVERDVPKGLELLKASARGGCAPARLALVELYEQGAAGIEPDPEQARGWSQPAPAGLSRILKRS